MIDIDMLRDLANKKDSHLDDMIFFAAQGHIAQ